MKPNISLVNAVFRIACGLTIMSAASAKFTKSLGAECTSFTSLWGP